MVCHLRRQPFSGNPDCRAGTFVQGVLFSTPNNTLMCLPISSASVRLPLRSRSPPTVRLSGRVVSSRSRICPDCFRRRGDDRAEYEEILLNASQARPMALPGTLSEFPFIVGPVLPCSDATNLPILSGRSCGSPEMRQNGGANTMATLDEFASVIVNHSLQDGALVLYDPRQPTFMPIRWAQSRHGHRHRAQ
jgi:hypothetical protein